MVQWVGLGAFTARTWDQSLVGELRSHKPCGMAKKIFLIKVIKQLEDLP